MLPIFAALVMMTGFRIAPGKAIPAAFLCCVLFALGICGGCFNSSEYFSQAQTGCRQCNFAELCRDLAPEHAVEITEGHEYARFPL